jgi:adapter protein MecA 1/2
MEFKRINKDTVTCIITEDDMDEQGIKLEDLFEKKKEAMDFLHEVMRRAEEEVDYKPTGSFMPMQITVLPDHSISLTLSENSSASFGEILKNLTDKAGIKIPKKVLEDLGDSVDEERLNRLNEYLKSLKQFTNSVKDMLDETKGATQEGSDKVSLNKDASIDSTKKKADKITNYAPKATPGKAAAEYEANAKRLNFHECMFAFNDLRTVIEFSKKAPKNLNIGSALYKHQSDGKYYLDLFRRSEDPKSFASLFTMAYEFGHFQATNKNVIAHVKENCDCIIRLDAIPKLSDI